MRIGYITTCPKVPVGGVAVIVWHVALLREMGYDAFLVPDKPGLDLWWMDPKPDVPLGAITDDMDLWVIPEVDVNLVDQLKGQKVIFVQNHSLMRNIEKYSNALAAMAVSEPSAEEIKKRINLPVFVVNPFIHPDSPFVFSDKKVKDSVVILGRKKASTFIDYILPRLESLGFKVDIASNLTQRALSKRYQMAEYYLHLSYPEGWPAPVAEAMKCGCCAVGFAGTGGLDFMKHMETAYVLEDGDAAGCIKALKYLKGNPEVRNKLVRQARDLVSIYTPQRTKSQLARFVEYLQEAQKRPQKPRFSAGEYKDTGRIKKDAPEAFKKFDIYSPMMQRIIEWESQQAEELGSILLEAFRPKTVMDLGCGPGIYLLPFRRAGCRVLGVDACQEAGKLLGRKEFILADLTKPLDLPRFDLCLCIEVGEHIQEGYSAVLVENCTVADTVFWSAAGPGQKGTEHVNCQPKDFWIRIFESFGFYYDKDVTSSLLKKMSECPGIKRVKWLLWNAMIFRKETT